MRLCFLRGAREELPQRDQREEIRALVTKLQVCLVGRLRALERTLARIGDRQRARDDQALGEAVVLARREHDAPDARVERQDRKSTRLNSSHSSSSYAVFCLK